MTTNQFMKAIFDGVTKSIAQGKHLDDEINTRIEQLVEAKIEQKIPNVLPKAASHISGSIHDPESGWDFEALSGTDMVSAGSFGTPIMNADLYNQIIHPVTEEQKKISEKITGQDKDWEEDLYSNDWLKKYQIAKDLKIKTLLNNYNPIKASMITGLPFNVVSKYNPLAAALITSKDYATLQVNNNLVATLGLAQTTFNEANGFGRVSAPQLVAKYWKFDNSSLKIEKDVPEGQIIEETKSEITQVTYRIGKNAGAVGATWESSLVVTEGDPYGMINGRIGNLLSNARSEILIDQMEATAQAAAGGADMGDMTGDRSSNDPTDFFQPVIDALKKRTDTFDNPFGSVSLFSSAKAFTKFLNNTFVKGWFQPNGRMVLTGEEAGAGAFLPIDSTWRTTDKIVATLLYAIDPRAIPAGIGPTQRSEWFDGRNLSRATYYFDGFGTWTVAPELTAVWSDVVTV